MDSQTIYENLREFMDSLGSGFPKTESGVEIKILKKLFTPEQAELYVKLPREPESAETIAVNLSLPVSSLGPELEEMAAKGLLFRARENGETRYQVFQFIIGIYEFQLNTLDRELAEMVEEYFPHYGMALAASGVQTKQLRITPVASAIDAATPVANYNLIREQIKNQELIAVQNCICRKEQGLLDSPCSHPHETCFSFGSFAQYYIDNNMGRKIELQEAMQILDQAETSGLIVSPSNSKDMVCICCCCPCCCPTVRYSKFFPEPVKNFKTYYQSKIEPELCTACQECFERCPMEAIKETETASEVDPARCIGCGLCVSVCPENAISLKLLEGIEEPPEFIEDTFQKIMDERGKVLP